MRKELSVFFAAVLLWPLALHSAEAGEVPVMSRVGILIPETGRSESQMIKGLRDELRARGYHEGKTLAFEVRDAKGDRSALKNGAEELVTQEVHLIFTTGTRATQAAKSATSKIPIVFVHPADPVALGLVKTMARPDANLTGVAALSLQMTEKRMRLLKEIFPGVERVLIFFDANDPFARKNFLFAERTAAKVGLAVSAYPVKTSEEFKVTLSKIQNARGDVLFHIPDNLVEGQADFLFDSARKKRLPTMSYEEKWAIEGAMAAYGPSYYQMGRQAAGLADAILKGQNPGNLEIERANKFDLVLNNRTAYLTGFTFSREILKKADKVIR